MVTFTTIKITAKKDGKSWYIAGYRQDGSFELLAVLDKPLTFELVQAFAHMLAVEFEASEIIEDGADI